MIPANLQADVVTTVFRKKRGGSAQKTSENKPAPRTRHAREGVHHPKHRICSGPSGTMRNSASSPP